MKRLSPGIAISTAALLISVGAVRCIPNPDTSGLPPYDAGNFAYDASIPPTSSDASFDATMIVEDAGPAAEASADGAAVGTLSGYVADFTQGHGEGVVAGAVVSIALPSGVTSGVTLPPSATTDPNGQFSIPNVPAGIPLLLGVTRPTDLARGIAYSTSELSVTVGAGQIANVFPVLHEGCFQIYELSPTADAAGNQPVTMQNATCPGGIGFGPTTGRTGSFASMTFDPISSFKDQQGHTFAATMRVEMIPLAYPDDDPIDFSWASGLPGAATPAGLLGAAEYRVVKHDPGQSDDGDLLAISPSAPVTIAIPIYTAPTAQASASSFDTSTGAWTTSGVKPSAVQTSDGDPGIDYVTVAVSQLGWWGATNAATSIPTTCVTGTISDGTLLPNVFVRVLDQSTLWTTTAVSGGAGSFCLDVPATVDGGTPDQLALLVQTLQGGVIYTADSPITVTTSAGSCEAAGGPTGCTSLSTILLAPTGACIAGNIVDAGSSPLDEILTSLPIGVADRAAGIQPAAYLGQVTPGTNGAFCAPAPVLDQGDLELVQPDASNCFSDFLPQGFPSPSGACGVGGCVDAGTIGFGCFSP